MLLLQILVSGGSSHCRERVSIRLVVCSCPALAATPPLPPPTPHPPTPLAHSTGDTIYNLSRFNELETDDSDRPVHPPVLTRADVLWNPFDDLQPRVDRWVGVAGWLCGVLLGCGRGGEEWVGWAGVRARVCSVGGHHPVAAAPLSNWLSAAGDNRTPLPHAAAGMPRRAPERAGDACARTVE